MCGVDMSIIIGADCVPTKSNQDLFVQGKIEELIGEELIKALDRANYRIINLECPLIDEPNQIIKNRPSLFSPRSTINCYKNMKVNLCALANNHIMDQDIIGLQSTISTLQKEGICFVGVGSNLEEARQPFIIVDNNKKIGIYACVEHEFSVAGSDRPGANPYDPLVTFDDIQELKKKCDKTIVLYHGGKEHYRLPSPQLQRICRKMIESGADIVICQHSHCIGCKEDYNGGVIVYGQGNFIFDYSDIECWQTGLLIEITDDFAVHFLPVVKHRNKVRAANEKEKNTILSSFYDRSELCIDEEYIRREYEQFAEKQLSHYLLVSAGIGKKNILYRILRKIAGNRFDNLYLSSRYKMSEINALLNAISCESHSELFMTGLDLHRRKGVSGK